jgi:hypothetical protein
LGGRIGESDLPNIPGGFNLQNLSIRSDKSITPIKMDLLPVVAGEGVLILVWIARAYWHWISPGLSM